MDFLKEMLSLWEEVQWKGHELLIILVQHPRCAPEHVSPPLPNLQSQAPHPPQERMSPASQGCREVVCYLLTASGWLPATWLRLRVAEFPFASLLASYLRKWKRPVWPSIISKVNSSIRREKHTGSLQCTFSLCPHPLCPCRIAMTTLCPARLALHPRKLGPWGHTHKAPNLWLPAATQLWVTFSDSGFNPPCYRSSWPSSSSPPWLLELQQC